MPKNTGTPPAVEFVDLRMRGGHIVRRAEPGKWRWSLDDARFPQEWAFDIESWQAVK